MIPKIVYPIFFIDQPSTKKKLAFRRYLVKEEKILLLAKESKDINDILRAIKDVVNVCCQEEDFNVNEIPLFDLEFIFLRLRAASVNNMENFVVKDVEDGKEYPLSINFNDVEVQFDENAPDKNIKVDDKTVMVMQYPMASIYDNKDFKERLAAEGLFELVVNCVDKVFSNDEYIEMSHLELRDFIDSLDVKTFHKIKDFLLSTPSIRHSLKYINSNGNEKILTFNSLMDFFLYL
jgi:hypothetical protein